MIRDNLGLTYGVYMVGKDTTTFTGMIECLGQAKLSDFVSSMAKFFTMVTAVDLILLVYDTSTV